MFVIFLSMIVNRSVKKHAFCFSKWNCTCPSSDKMFLWHLWRSHCCMSKTSPKDPQDQGDPNHGKSHHQIQTNDTAPITSNELISTLKMWSRKHIRLPRHSLACTVSWPNPHQAQCTGKHTNPDKLTATLCPNMLRIWLSLGVLQSYVVILLCYSSQVIINLCLYNV